ncbi:type IX secretion system membrane protein PorP/SprF [Candidatus Woesearchaeota archaeon]|nr:type IX secretion system membrane protein PorP/SprF [Candidatus Woesearchaeota archaeon]
MKKILVLFVCVACTLAVNGQQLLFPNSNLRVALSPGATGVEEQVFSCYQGSFSNFGGTKTNTVLTGFDKLYRYNIASGFMLRSQLSEFWNHHTLQIPLAVHVRVLRSAYLSVGFAPELQIIDVTSFDDWFREHYHDPMLLRAGRNHTNVNLSLGLSFNSPFYFLDLGAQQVLSLPVRLDESLYEPEPCYVVHTGGKIPFGKSVFLRPSVAAQGTVDPLLYVVEPGIALSYRGRFSAGYSLLISDFEDNKSFVHKTRIRVRTLDHVVLSVAYLIGDSWLYSYSQGTFQLGITFDLKRSTTNIPPSSIRGGEKVEE